MKKLRFLTIIIILLSFSCLECKKDNHDDTDLLKTKWTLSYIKDTKKQAITNFPTDAPKTISIEFTDKSNLLFFRGICNVGSGTYCYSSATDIIKVTDLITTEIYCKYYEWETYTVQNLYNASNYLINGTELVIFSTGAYNLYFTKN